MTNLFEFLTDVLETARTNDGVVHLTPAHRLWMENFLRAPDVELHFAATPTGKIVETADGPLPEMITNYLVRGEPRQVFELMSEAALQNPGFYRLCEGVTAFMKNHVPTCSDCQQKVAACDMADPGPDFWQFKPHNLQP